ncbi:MAG: tetratricopeptide repeat protein [Methanoregulaceae archaeon]|jgi:tetratricopeptide (TPR) repeat protein|nr:tetratricopeptide repeat protein [Methanoregulaceae archaeon]
MERGLLILFIRIIFSAGCISTAQEWNQRGETHHTLGRYEEAVAAFDQAIATDSDQSEAWKNRGLSLALLGGDDSEESFAMAISLNPMDNEVYYYQALSRNATGNRPGALIRLDKAIAFSPQNRDQAITLFQALILQGDLLTLENRFNEANVSYQRVHEIMMSTI